MSSLVFIDKPAAMASLSVFGTANGRVCVGNSYLYCLSTSSTSQLNR